MSQGVDYEYGYRPHNGSMDEQILLAFRATLIKVLTMSDARIPDCGVNGKSSRPAEIRKHEKDSPGNLQTKENSLGHGLFFEAKTTMRARITYELAPSR